MSLITGKHRFAVAALGIALLSLTSGIAFAGGTKKAVTEKPSENSNAPVQVKESSVPRQFLVALSDEATVSKRASLWKKYSAKELEKVGSSALFLIEFAEGSDGKKLVKDLAKEPGVRYAEPNLIMKTMPVKPLTTE